MRLLSKRQLKELVLATHPETGERQLLSETRAPRQRATFKNRLD